MVVAAVPFTVPVAVTVPALEPLLRLSVNCADEFCALAAIATVVGVILDPPVWLSDTVIDPPGFVVTLRYWSTTETFALKNREFPTVRPSAVQVTGEGGDPEQAGVMDPAV